MTKGRVNDKTPSTQMNSVTKHYPLRPSQLHHQAMQ